MEPPQTLQILQIARVCLDCLFHSLKASHLLIQLFFALLSIKKPRSFERDVQVGCTKDQLILTKPASVSRRHLTFYYSCDSMATVTYVL